jgi:hypothetical protein
MIKKHLFSIAAVVLAIAFSAFTKPAETSSNEYFSPVLIWFQVDAMGNAINSANGQSGTNPFGCSGSPTLCARALTYDSANPSASEVTLNGDGVTYTIKSGVNITTDFDGTLRKNP